MATRAIQAEYRTQGTGSESKLPKSVNDLLSCIAPQPRQPNCRTTGEEESNNCLNKIGMDGSLDEINAAAARARED